MQEIRDQEQELQPVQTEVSNNQLTHTDIDWSFS